LALSLDDSSRYEGYVDGHIAGRAEGRAEGAKAQSIAIARAMKQHGDDIDYIAQITGLTPDEIAKI
jgi:predicted transposase YdaD